MFNRTESTEQVALICPHGVDPKYILEVGFLGPDEHYAAMNRIHGDEQRLYRLDNRNTQDKIVMLSRKGDAPEKVAVSLKITPPARRKTQALLAIINLNQFDNDGAMHDALLEQLKKAEEFTLPLLIMIRGGDSDRVSAVGHWLNTISGQNIAVKSKAAGYRELRTLANLAPALGTPQEAFGSLKRPVVMGKPLKPVKVKSLMDAITASPFEASPAGQAMQRMAVEAETRRVREAAARDEWRAAARDRDQSPDALREMLGTAVQALDDALGKNDRDRAERLRVEARFEELATEAARAGALAAQVDLLENKIKRMEKSGLGDHGFSEEYFCPITMERMVDPVMTADGHTFERAAIERWFAAGNTTSPITRIEIGNELIPNHTLRKAIEDAMGPGGAAAAAPAPA
ncbi:MAG: U-box domain-containing protein [Gammaproteobacteria bacterium]|nr:U-box domain-containing protein [Gammaproteobacteria bacterium]